MDNGNSGGGLDGVRVDKPVGIGVPGAARGGNGVNAGQVGGAVSMGQGGDGMNVGRVGGAVSAEQMASIMGVKQGLGAVGVQHGVNNIQSVGLKSLNKPWGAGLANANSMNAAVPMGEVIARGPDGVVVNNLGMRAALMGATGMEQVGQGSGDVVGQSLGNAVGRAGQGSGGAIEQAAQMAMNMMSDGVGRMNQAPQGSQTIEAMQGLQMKEASQMQKNSPFMAMSPQGNVIDADGQEEIEEVMEGGSTDGGKEKKVQKQMVEVVQKLDELLDDPRAYEDKVFDVGRNELKTRYNLAVGDGNGV